MALCEAILGSKLEPMGYPTGASQMMSLPAEMSAYGAGGALSKAAHGGPGVGGIIVYFIVEDCAATQGRAVKTGGSVVSAKFSIGDFGWVLLCRDAEGNMIGVKSISSHFIGKTTAGSQKVARCANN